MNRIIGPAALAAAIGLGCEASLAAAEEAAAPYSGPKTSVFVDVVGAAESMYGGPQFAGTTNEGLNAMFVDALVRSGRFVVVERVALGDVQLEQDLARGGSTTAEAAPAQGKMLGASAVVRATVTKFEAAAGGSGIQLGVPFGRFLGAGAGVNERRSIVEFSVRLIDTTTGQVIGTYKASGTASASSTSVSAVNNRSGASVGGSTFQNTPLGEAAEAAINAAVRQITDAMGRVPWSASVVAFDDGKVYVNAGAAQNLKAGTKLRVLRKGKALTDPGTGEVLEVLMTSVGSIEVQSVTEKISIAVLTSGDPPARGDLVRLDPGPGADPLQRKKGE